MTLMKAALAGLLLGGILIFCLGGLRNKADYSDVTWTPVHSSDGIPVISYDAASVYFSVKNTNIVGTLIRAEDVDDRDATIRAIFLDCEKETYQLAEYTFPWYGGVKLDHFSDMKHVIPHTAAKDLERVLCGSHA